MRVKWNAWTRPLKTDSMSEAATEGVLLYVHLAICFLATIFLLLAIGLLVCVFFAATTQNPIVKDIGAVVSLVFGSVLVSGVFIATCAITGAMFTLCNYFLLRLFRRSLSYVGAVTLAIILTALLSLLPPCAAILECVGWAGIIPVGIICALNGRMAAKIHDRMRLSGHSANRQ